MLPKRPLMRSHVASWTMEDAWLRLSVSTSSCIGPGELFSRWEEPYRNIASSHVMVKGRSGDWPNASSHLLRWSLWIRLLMRASPIQGTIGIGAMPSGTLHF